MSLFAEFGILIGIATLVSFAMRYFKQPLLVGYILAGLLVGPFVFGVLHSTETITFFSEIGIAILLFTVGLNINPKIFKDFGKVSVVTGVVQILVTFALGYILCTILGFSNTASFYVGAALSFSSTIVVLKLISDKGDLDTLYAKVSIGLLLVQDIVAILLLFAVPIFSSEKFSLAIVLNKFSFGILVIAFLMFCSKYIFPKINNFISGSDEMLLLFSIAWGIGIAALFKVIGFSLESGALIAGASLSVLPSRYEINSRLGPLRDFFLVLFFLSLGSQISPAGIIVAIPVVLLLSAFVLFGKSVIIMTVLGLLGYKKRTGFQTGTVNAQISEFSLIFLALGVKLGAVSPDVLSIVTMVGLVTILGSAYFVIYSEKIYLAIANDLNIFQRADAHETKVVAEGYPMILIGTGRIGYDFYQLFKKNKKDFLVIDHNPDVVEELREVHGHVMYGDASDLDFLETVSFKQAEMVISTIPNLETNLLIADVARKESPDYDAIIMIAVSQSIEDALSLYDVGYDYVILPHFIGGSFAVELLQKLKNNKAKFKKYKEEHREYLKSKIELGLHHKHK